MYFITQYCRRVRTFLLLSNHREGATIIVRDYTHQFIVMVMEMLGQHLGLDVESVVGERSLSHRTAPTTEMIENCLSYCKLLVRLLKQMCIIFKEKRNVLQNKQVHVYFMQNEMR